MSSRSCGPDGQDTAGILGDTGKLAVSFSDDLSAHVLGKISGSDERDMKGVCLAMPGLVVLVKLLEVRVTRKEFFA